MESNESGTEWQRRLGRGKRGFSSSTVFEGRELEFSYVVLVLAETNINTERFVGDTR